MGEIIQVDPVLSQGPVKQRQEGQIQIRRIWCDTRNCKPGQAGSL